VFVALRTYAALCKLQIALFTSFSAVTGYVLASPRLGGEALILISGVFFLACGSGALNQYQERDIDAFMARTRHRPLPSKRLTPKHALSAALVLIASGLWLMFVLGLPVVVLGCFAVIWYNGIYTYLKRITAFAVIPGALIGAVSPCMGWVAGGGALSDPRLWVLCFLFFVWQVPHFWLVLLNHGEDYEQAGLPSLTRLFSSAQVQRITFVWTLAVAVSGMLLPLFGHHSRVFELLLVAAAGWLGWQGIKFSKSCEEVGGHRLFRQINAYVFFLMALLTVEGLVGVL
jgi:protoheme IX farnesyltransferase